MRSRIYFYPVMALGLMSASTHAFQMSMVGSSLPRSNVRVPKTFSPPIPSAPRPKPFDLSSGLISQLAIIALKARLRDHTSVDCDVTARADSFLFGTVGPVTVKGRGWQSGLGLTCRAIEATVDVCELDKSRILMDRKLVLKQPSSGHALIAMNQEDFGNFLAHPLVQPPVISIPRTDDIDNSLEFLNNNVDIDAASGTVMFYASFRGEKWACSLKRSSRSSKKADVKVYPTDEVVFEGAASFDEISSTLSDAITSYFNDIVFELDGTFLTFQDMMVTSKGSSPSVMLKMGITVHKFPSRNLAF